jgi:PIN domain nuclease of toxin-antitoxin system
LLDTHILYWWLVDDARISDEERHMISDAEAALVSTASIWEMSLKRTIGKLKVPDDLPSQLSRHDFAVLPVHLDHALRVGELPPLHRDPFDRMLVAQAQLEELVIATQDPRIAQYGVPTVPEN